MPRVASLLLAGLLIPAASAALEYPAVFPDEAIIGSAIPRGEIETHSPETLWEKINGEAELFLRFGVTGAAFARYEDREDIDRSLGIALYILPDSLSAFGLFATFSPPGEPHEGFGNGAVVGDYQGYLWHGRHFVMADAFGSPEERAGAMRSALSVIASTLGPPPAVPASLESFRRVAEPSTVSYRPEHLLGREVFPPGLEGKLPGGTPVFRATGPVSAETILSAYRAVLENPTERRQGAAVLLSGTDPHLGPVTIAARGERLAGARALQEGEGIREILLKLLEEER